MQSKIQERRLKAELNFSTNILHGAYGFTCSTTNKTITPGPQHRKQALQHEQPGSAGSMGLAFWRKESNPHRTVLRRNAHSSFLSKKPSAPMAQTFSDNCNNWASSFRAP
ncbi:MAG: hypothetical protein R6U69_06730, partial [Marinobacter sp.]|uniref:hypothetical protein n=1 Tax=Marinobacter sp. TaxID=50741 RepID=UPI003974DF4A